MGGGLAAYGRALASAPSTAPTGALPNRIKAKCLRWRSSKNSAERSQKTEQGKKTGSPRLLLICHLCPPRPHLHDRSCADELHLDPRAELHAGQRGPWPPGCAILHVLNSDFDTVHYCSKRVAPLIFLKSEIKLRHCLDPTPRARASRRVASASSHTAPASSHAWHLASPRAPLLGGA